MNTIDKINTVAGLRDAIPSGLAENAGQECSACSGGEGKGEEAVSLPFKLMGKAGAD